MKRSSVILLVIYAAALMGTAMAQFSGSPGLEYVCRPLLMITLGLWFYLNSRRYGDRFTLLVQAGLFFSLIGDITLMVAHFDGFYFLVGLAALMLGFVCYAIAFAQNVFDAEGTDGLGFGGMVAVLLLGAGFFAASDLMRFVDEDLTIPVIAFITCGTLMGIAAGFRYQRTFSRSFWLVFVGALLLMASGTLICWNRFARPMAMPSALIVVAYGMAQFLIAWGCLVHVLDPDSIRKKAALEA